MSRNKKAKSQPELNLYWCSRHQSLFDKSMFYTNKRASLGVMSVCKTCSKDLATEQRVKNPASYLAAAERYRKSENGAAYKADWEEKNKERRAAWRAEYMPRKLTLNRERVMLKSEATPSWANKVEVRKIYVEAKTLTKSTGVQHDVDHIIPLKGRNVCGLHVESNLRVITADENRRKSNQFHQV